MLDLGTEGNKTSWLSINKILKIPDLLRTINISREPEENSSNLNKTCISPPKAQSSQRFDTLKNRPPRLNIYCILIGIWNNTAFSKRNGLYTVKGSALRPTLQPHDNLGRANRHRNLSPFSIRMATLWLSLFLAAVVRCFCSFYLVAHWQTQSNIIICFRRPPS